MSAIDDFLTEWTTAEREGDVTTLDRLLTDDFVGVGPLGFVLSKPAWLRRFADGLAYDHVDLEEIETHDHDNAAVVTARQVANGTVGGNPLPFDALRCTLTIVGADGRRQLAAIHMSFIAGTPEAPPLPTAARPAPSEVR
jgi:hypothetical protein